MGSSMHEFGTPKGLRCTVPSVAPVTRAKQTEIGRWYLICHRCVQVHATTGSNELGRTLIKSVLRDQMAVVVVDANSTHCLFRAKPAWFDKGGTTSQTKDQLSPTSTALNPTKCTFARVISESQKFRAPLCLRHVRPREVRQ